MYAATAPRIRTRELRQYSFARVRGRSRAADAPAASQAAAAIEEAALRRSMSHRARCSLLSHRSRGLRAYTPSACRSLIRREHGATLDSHLIEHCAHGEAFATPMPARNGCIFTQKRDAAQSSRFSVRGEAKECAAQAQYGAVVYARDGAAVQRKGVKRVSMQDTPLRYATPSYAARSSQPRRVYRVRVVDARRAVGHHEGILRVSRYFADGV